MWGEGLGSLNRPKCLTGAIRSVMVMMPGGDVRSLRFRAFLLIFALRMIKADHREAGKGRVPGYPGIYGVVTHHDTTCADWTCIDQMEA